jgi:hypothetical protein
MIDPFDGNHFVISFPIWGIFAPGPGDIQLAVRLPNGGRSSLLFTEEVLAERYRDSEPTLKGHPIKLISNAAYFRNVLANCKRYGIEYVTFDPADTASAHARAVPIDRIGQSTLE